jgi:hypothetical protein
LWRLVLSSPFETQTIKMAANPSSHSGVEIVSLEGMLFTKLYVCSPTQRWYEWEKIHTDEFWMDLAKMQGKRNMRHPFNTMLCGTQNPPVMIEDAHEVMLPALLLTDGQQRLTRFMVLLNCIRFGCIEASKQSHLSAQMRNFFEQKAGKILDKIFYKVIHLI